MLRYFAILLAVTAWAEDSAYQTSLAKWRQEREAKLKADGGWLTVTGLSWLKEGANRVDGAPGVFELNKGKTLFRADRGGSVTSQEKPISTIQLDKPDISFDADSMNFRVIERSGRYGVRIKDKNSKLRKAFTGLHWFPARESYRVTAKFVPHPKPKDVPILNIIGNHLKMPSPGYVIFKLDNHELRLEPVIDEGEDELMFIFRDKTAGKETYPAGRYLYAAMPREGKVELDFNKAENPPCAFTPYATCPLPPKQNILPIRIEAGEQSPHK